MSNPEPEVWFLDEVLFHSQSGSYRMMVPPGLGHHLLETDLSRTRKPRCSLRSDGSYPYRCKPLEYDLYNGVTQDLWYKGRVVAKGHPNWTRCSYCCGLTFEVFYRAMQYRNIQKGLDPDDYNGMSFSDLFNLLQFWYIEGAGDSPQFGITSYGLGKKIENLEDAQPGDFLDFSRNNKSGHSVIFVDWTRDAAGKITGFKYFSSNSAGFASSKMGGTCSMSMKWSSLEMHNLLMLVRYS